MLLFFSCFFAFRTHQHFIVILMNLSLNYFEIAISKYKSKKKNETSIIEVQHYPALIDFI